MTNGTGKDIGRLEGKMDLMLDEVKTIRIKVDKIETRGCVQGEANAGRVVLVEKRLDKVIASRLSGRDIIKLLGGATGITALFTAATELIRHLGSK